MGRRIGVLAVIVLAMVGAPGCTSEAGAVKARAPGPTRVLLVGDSITAQYGPVAASALKAKGYAVTVAGVNGSGLLDQNVFSGARARQLRNVDPDVVVIEYTGGYQPLLGLSTAAPHLPTVAYGSGKFFKQWRASAVKQTRLYRKRPDVRVVWMLVPKASPDLPGGFTQIAKAIPTFNSMYRTLGTPTVDAWSAFGGGTYNPGLHEDGLHPNAAGRKVLADLVVDAVS